ncbi:hypothetical protein V5799_024257 [Amblyomma americanum]|uniref:Transposable element P transposase-like GTP-binding insertion domain-containing protein n=1 Tax=Amblyomma americanum TaxID=6943 RepID=A0AAQ4ECM3_AMBAM
MSPRSVHKMDEISKPQEDDTDAPYDMWALQAAGPEPMQVQVFVSGLPALDTGASVSIIGEDKFNVMFPGAQFEHCDVRLKVISAVLGKITAFAKLAAREATLPLFAVEGPCPTLLGRDWMEAFAITVTKRKELNAVCSVTSLVKEFADVISESRGHPLDESRQLYWSFDYCHILKNIRSQFLDEKRIFRNKGKLILPDYLRLVCKVQERQDAFKMVQCLTKKHLWPSNFEKMNVSRAVDIFSPQVTSVLRFLQQHGHRLGAPGFEDSLPTVEFMETVYKWFSVHNIKSTTFCTVSRDAWKMPFYTASDERYIPHG